MTPTNIMKYKLQSINTKSTLDYNTKLGQISDQLKK